MVEDWNIQNPARECAYTQKPFEKDEVVYTILSVEAEGLRRHDICEDAWKSAGGEEIRGKAGVISFWSHPYTPPLPPPPEPLKKEDAESILRSMLKTNLPEERDARYILAVMLERKRIFKHRQTIRGEFNVSVYEHAKTGETFTIETPHLKLNQLTEVQKQVATLLTGSLQKKTETDSQPVTQEA